MCTAGDLGKVWRGSEQDRVREERVILAAPARASARNRRVFVSLDFCILSCFSPEFSSLMCCFFCTYSVVCFTLKNSRRLFVSSARIISYDFCVESDRTSSDLRTVVVKS